MLTRFFLNFGGVLEAKMDPKIDFFDVFEGIFSHPYFSWIFGSKNHDFSLKIDVNTENGNFLKIVFPCRREHDFSCSQ